MNPETKACQNCKNPFTIEPEDFAFYEKMKVPPPTWCPECRQQRRYAWRNERTFYRRNCDLCGKSTVTIYSPGKPFKVYCPPCWWGDGWDAAEHGMDFDFSRPFFDQFRELQLRVPRIALLTKNSVNSEYTNHSVDNKNCYMCVSCFSGEDNLYSAWIMESRNCTDCNYIYGSSELLYDCVDSEKSYRCQNSALLKDCHDCHYSYDLHGCANCFLSANLRNKKYCFLNAQYSKEEYEQKIKEYALGSHRVRQALEKQFLEMISRNAIRRFVISERNVNSAGSMLLNCKNAVNCFDAKKLEDTRYIFSALDMKTSMDAYHVGINCELIYEGHGLTRGYHNLFCHLSYDNSHIAYCDMCHNNQNLFGCVGVKQSSYMIFNKRYDEAAYTALKEKIVAHMKTTGEYGEFFPPRISPVAYNETQGQVYMPLAKEEVLARGWQWEDNLPGTFGKETLKAEEIPDDIGSVPDDILNAVFACEKCKRNYNIVRPELDFYRRETIPIPRNCLECRFKKRVALRAPRKLWHRQCMCDYKTHENSAVHARHEHGRCPNEFETSYAPDRPEIVYCEQCYNAEVV